MCHNDKNKHIIADGYLVVDILCLGTTDHESLGHGKDSLSTSSNLVKTRSMTSLAEGSRLDRGWLPGLMEAR